MIVLGLGAAPAFAHAQLLATSPLPGATLRASPPQIVLTYGEDVQAETDAIEVLTPNGQHINAGPSHHPTGRADQVAATLPPRLQGTYVVTWRVISADTHPVQGAFTFSVGAPTATGSTGGLEQHLLASRQGSPTVGALNGINRFATFAALLAFVGGAVIVLVGWPQGLRDRRTRGYLILTAAAVAFFALTGIALQDAYGPGRPLGDVLHTNLLDPVVRSRFGHASLLRALLALLTAAAVALRHADRRPHKIHQATAAILCIAMVTTVSLSGHGDTGRWQPLGLFLDIAHVAAASVWLGGLALITVCVLARRQLIPLPSGQVRTAILRYSALAAASLAVVVATGVVQAWRQIGSWELVTSTTYGRLLLLKTVAVAAVAETGWLSRRWVHAHLSPSTGDPVPTRPMAAGSAGPLGTAVLTTPQVETDVQISLTRLRRWFATEVALGLVVIALTTLLVDAAPPHDQTIPSAPAQPFTATITDANYQLAAAVTPGAVGTDQINLDLTDHNGNPVNPFQLYAQLNLPARKIGPLNVPLTHTGTGRWTATTTIPLAGRWQLYLGLLTTPTNEIDHTLNFQIDP